MGYLALKKLQAQQEFPLKNEMMNQETSASIKNESIGIVGLGLMGTAMSARLLELGYKIKVYNRTRSKADELIQNGAEWSDNPLRECSIAIIALYTTEIVEEVLDALSGEWHPNLFLIDTTTGDPTTTPMLGKRLQAQGATYLEVPVSGSSQQQRRSEVTAFVGGPEPAYQKALPLLNDLTKEVLFVGGWGAGVKVKLLTNLVLGLNRAALAEGLVYAKTLGIDTNIALEALLGSMAFSKIMTTKGQKMVDGDFSVQARLIQHLKDIDIILDTAKAESQDLPLTETHRQLLQTATDLGWGEADNSAIIQAISKEKRES